MYSLLRPILFTLPPELAHHLALVGLKRLPAMLLPQPQHQAVFNCMGMTLPNRIGLAAGFDKNGDYLAAFAKLGFGFIEIGTVTPRPQVGNPKPRLFRLVKDKAIINRMGFNNKGVDYLVNRLKKTPYSGILGINIGKNLSTPLIKADQDYQTCLKKVYPYADYVTVNVSSPNTPGLRDLQQGALLNHLFSTLKQSQQRLADTHGRYVPLLAKLAPDLDELALTNTARVLNDLQMDGFVFSNTTNQRPISLKEAQLAKEAGGLSGAPLMSSSTRLLCCLKQHTDKPIIAAGGVMSPEDAKEKIKAGASLVQLYTGLVYQGPSLVKQCIEVTSQPES